MKQTYAVIYEWGGKNYGVYSPDVPGCVSTGETLEEAQRNFREALEAHLELTAERGYEIPQAVSQVGYMEVDVPAAAVRAAG